MAGEWPENGLLVGIPTVHVPIHIIPVASTGIPHDSSPSCPNQFELLLAAASKRDHESPRISVQTHLRITESIESDMLSHDRHASIKLYTVVRSPLFDYGVPARLRRTQLRIDVPRRAGLL